MAAFVKHNSFVQDLARKVFNLHTDTIKFALSTGTPAAVDAYASLATEVASGNGYTTGGATLAGQSATQAAGVLTFTGTNPTWTATASGFSFRYSMAYSDTAASKQVIGHWDYGSTLTLASGDTVTLVIAGTGILTIT